MAENTVSNVSNDCNSNSVMFTLISQSINQTSDQLDCKRFYNKYNFGNILQEREEKGKKKKRGVGYSTSYCGAILN